MLFGEEIKMNQIKQGSLVEEIKIDRKVLWSKSKLYSVSMILLEKYVHF